MSPESIGGKIRGSETTHTNPKVIFNFIIIRFIIIFLFLIFFY